MANPFYLAGQNASYELGFGDNVAKLVHTSSGDWKKIITCTYTGGGRFALGIKPDGTLWGVGSNYNGQLSGLPNYTYNNWTQIGSLNTWVDIAAGNRHALMLNSSGILYSSGLNTSGQCGVGNTNPVTTMIAVSGGHVFTKIFAAGDHSFGIDSAGDVWSWGENGSDGMLGLGTTSASYLIPFKITTLGSPVATLALNQYTTFAVLDNGKLYGWGRGSSGILAQGSGDTGVHTSPVQIGLATNWVSASVGFLAGYAINSSGEVYSWGSGTYFATVQGVETEIYAPTKIGVDTDWVSVAGGYYNVILSKSTGEIFVCGFNPYGQLGTGEPGYSHNISVLTSLQGTYSLSFPEGIPVVRQTLADSSIEITPALGSKVSAPIHINVVNISGKASAPININVFGEGSASAQINIAVVDSLDTTFWSAKVLLNGEDISSKLVGLLTVDAEENAARIANFTILPSPGVITPTSWTGSDVSIDVVRIISGVSVPTRVFTGLVNIATFDPNTRQVNFSCTDDLQNKVADLSKADIDKLTNGIYSEAVHGVLDENWQYAQARMETRTACLDAGAYGQLRTTEWFDLPVLYTFTNNDLLDENIQVDLQRRSDIVNTVNIEYEYRFFRCRERRAWISWSQSYLLAESYKSGYQFPTQDEIQSAFQGCGWHPVIAIYGNAPPTIPVSDPVGYWVPIPEGSVSNFAGYAIQRHSQAITEKYTATITADTSVSANGSIAKPLRGSLQSTWSPNEWEADYNIAVPDVSSGEVDYAGTNTRELSDVALQALLDTAKATILGSHRKASVSFNLLCLPELDLNCAAILDTDVVYAQGKIARIHHTLDIENGEATSNVTLALSGVASGGIITPTDLAPPTPPDPDVGQDDWVSSIPQMSTHIGAVNGYAYSDDYNGFLPEAIESYSVTNGADTVAHTNAFYDPSPEYAQESSGFKIKMPGVSSNYRNPVEAIGTYSYSIVIPVDTFTLTI